MLPEFDVKDSDPDVGLLPRPARRRHAPIPRPIRSCPTRHPPARATARCGACALLDARMIVLQRQGRVGFYGARTGQEATPIATGLAVARERLGVPGAARAGASCSCAASRSTSSSRRSSATRATCSRAGRCRATTRARSVNQVSWSSCIGPQIPQAVGCAWAMKMQEADRVVAVGFCGDGATSQPDFHNAMNFAGVFQHAVRHRLPEQPLVDQRAHVAPDGVAHDRRQGPRVRRAGRARRRQRCAGRLQGRLGEAFERARSRRRAHVRRGAHVPHRRPLDERRPDALPQRRRGRGVEEEGPARPPPQAPRRCAACSTTRATRPSSEELHAGDRRRPSRRSSSSRPRPARRSSTTSTPSCRGTCASSERSLAKLPPAPTHN